MTPSVADLAWVMTGQGASFVGVRDRNLIESDTHLSQYWLPDALQRLAELAAAPEKLTQALAACKSHFLGSYFETLFSFAIQHFSSLTIVAEHVQIRHQGKTLGEVDMLVQTPQGTLLQFEIAIKFYLQRADFYPNQWVGPNKNDSLYKKVSRARSHQLQVLQSSAGRDLLRALNLPAKVAPKLLIFGRLYLSLDTPNKWDNLQENTIYGGWVRVSEAVTLLSYFSHFEALIKPHWLVGPTSSPDSQRMSMQCIETWKAGFITDSRPQHIYVWSEARGAADGRFMFIVPDDW